MAYVPGFEFDVFVSYAHVDDRPGAYGSDLRWVSRFVDRLRSILHVRVPNGDELRVFFDNQALSSNDHLQTAILPKVRSSAVFVPIISPSYVTRAWTLDELKAFTEQPWDGRLFAVEVLPLDSDIPYPPPLDQLIRKMFHTTDPLEAKSVLPLSGDAFDRRMMDLAVEIGRKLREMRSAGTAATAASVGIAAAPAGDAPTERPLIGQTILLAESTDDLLDERDSLRTYLEQFGATVLPRSDYPMGGADFRAAVEADIAAANAFVQLLGPRAGKKPADLPEGYPAFQFEAARERGLKILQWRRPDIVPGQVADPAHRDLVSGENVIASGLEAFKTEVKTRLTPPPPPVKKTIVDVIEDAPYVFINADQTDLGLAETLRKELFQRRCEAHVPITAGNSQTIRQAIEGHIVACDVLVLMYGSTEPGWVALQWQLIRKLRRSREAPFRLVALCKGPPEDEKPDFGGSIPDLREYDFRHGIGPETAERIVAELHQ